MRKTKKGVQVNLNTFLLYYVQNKVVINIKSEFISCGKVDILFNYTVSPCL